MKLQSAAELKAEWEKDSILNFPVTPRFDLFNTEYQGMGMLSPGADEGAIIRFRYSCASPHGPQRTMP